MPKTYTKTIEGVGQFTWRIPRSMKDELAIAAEFSRITEGVERPTPWLSSMAEMLSVLKVLTIEQPDDWDIDGMDPLEPETYKKITEVFGALTAAEGRFRGKREGDRQADGGDRGAVVPTEVQPTT